MLLFSDLHLSPKTFQTSLKVLRRVHKEATDRALPVGFLGDFFDHVYNKGTLPVDILNELMRFFANEWTVPMVMIPGNHDYFDASETEHGLTPFKYASKYITVLDEPTVLENRLWVPWRRDNAELETILAKNTGVECIFGHFDIIGFKLNASRVSTEGLSVSAFTTGCPVYSGHYHTPQVHGNICYLGSPYQLSLSEAEDKKALVVLDNVGKIDYKIPIDIGKHQYKWTPQQLQLKNHLLRPNDRVVVVGTVEGPLVADLIKRGIDINVRKILSVAKTRIDQPIAMTQQQLLREYARRHTIDVESVAWKSMLAWMTDNANESRLQTPAKICPVRMEISGFGPFVGPVHVPLSGQGFTLISGEYNQPGASNGAGKSMVTAGAWLWVVTGTLDGRSALPFDCGWSVVHGGTGTACVKVYGSLEDGGSWEIVRTLEISKKRKHTVTFSINNIDRTRSTISGTQRAISSEIFGMDFTGNELHSWLLRNSVWSQQSVSRWIDSSDINAKSEIQSLANMETWIRLHNWAKTQQKELKSALQVQSTVVDQSEKRHEEACVRHARNVRMADEWHARQSERIRNSSKNLLSIQSTYERSGDNPDSMEAPSIIELELVTKQSDKARVRLLKFEACRATVLEKLPNNWQEIAADPVPEVVGSLEESTIHAEQCKTTSIARKIQLDGAQKLLAVFKSEGHCSACQRPFEQKNGHQDHLRTLHNSLQKARDDNLKARSALKLAESSRCEVEKSVRSRSDQVQLLQMVKSLHNINNNIKQSRIDCDRIVTEKNILRTEYGILLSEYTTYVKTKSMREELCRTVDTLTMNHRILVDETCPYTVSVSEPTLTKKVLSSAKSELAIQSAKLQDTARVVRWTGAHGIQTYAMEHTVQKLTALTTVWLRKFFKMDDIRLEASFDEKERLKRHVICPGNSGIMSGGQWRRVQLASFMAWKDMNSVGFPLLIMDEACTSMDQMGINSVQETLRDWCESIEGHTCFFITHEPEQHRDTSIYQNHLRILNKRGRSSVVDDSVSKRRKLVKK